MKEKIQEHFKDDYGGFYGRYLPGSRALSGDEHAALCCFHDDHDPSLNWNSKTGLFKCHACGAGGDIFAFQMKRTGTNFKKALSGIASEFNIPLNGDGRKTKSQLGRIIKTYDYTDADGKLLFQVTRYDPKDFRQRRPDGKGGWIWSISGITPVLYRLPEVIRADEVIVCEGEKDADALTALGLTATTSPMGAGKWRPEYSDILTGKHVVLLPDNDQPGREHMRKVAESLFGKAKSIKMIELPGLPDKGDVSDYIKSFSDPETTVESLSMMIESAAPWEPILESALKVRSVFDAIAELEVRKEYADMLGSEQWYYENLIIKNQITLIVAKSGGGKTTIHFDYVAPKIMYIFRRVN